MNLSQLLIIGLPRDNDLSAITDLQPGGVVLMGRNSDTPTQTRRLTRAIKETLGIAPLVCTDQEGGRVQRFKDGFTPIPPARELAGSGARGVNLAAMNVAAELRAAGINWNFAPVCDVPLHPDDTVIGDRAFADSPIRAGAMAAEYVRGAQPNVLCCAKHFPGHGAVGADSHASLPTFTGTREALEPHLMPFRAAMGAGVASVMVGHISVPCVDDSGAPASLSAPVVTGLLRGEMGYRGLVVTDDLEMGALSDDAGTLAVRALAAGCDLLLWCHSSEKARAALKAIERALENGTLSETRVQDALERVDWAKRRYGVVASSA